MYQEFIDCIVVKLFRFRFFLLTRGDVGDICCVEFKLENGQVIIVVWLCKYHHLRNSLLY